VFSIFKLARTIADPAGIDETYFTPLPDRKYTPKFQRGGFDAVSQMVDKPEKL
jgi:hypothetical protein